MEGQEKRFVLALVLSFAFLFLYYNFIAPPPAVQPPAPVEGVAETAAPAAPSVQVAEPAPPLEVAPPLAAGAEELLRVETPLYTAVFSNRGAALTSFTLHGYLLEKEDPASQVELVRDPAGDVALPLASEFQGLGGAVGLSGALFTVEGGGLRLDEEGTGEITFRHRTAQGIELVKRYGFDGYSYALRTETELINRSGGPLNGRLLTGWNTGLESLDSKGSAMARYSFEGVTALVEDKLQKVKPKKLEGERFFVGPRWIASSDRYFTAAFLPQQGVEGALAGKADDGRVGISIYTDLNLMPGDAARQQATLYAGPKQMDSLKGVDESLTRVIDLGWFSIIAKPLLLLLNLFFRYLGNYGLAIILLTILIKIAFIPFSNASFRSMRKMSQLQPKINALRDRYRKDRDRLNQEVMALYKEERVNPAGGCLPILVQIPVFIALYRALLGAIELRHAPFVFWISDLSAKDPYYITPIAMGVTMFLQQKLTPTAVDPKQAQIMLFMPIVFTAMFLNLPSGLVLYWMVNNILSIGHQYLMLRQGATADAAAAAVEVQGKGKKARRQG